MNDEWLREQTARLFALANDARQKHEHDLADLVTEVACRVLGGRGQDAAPVTNSFRNTAATHPATAAAANSARGQRVGHHSNRRH